METALKNSLQSKIYTFIVSRVNVGMPPTLREIGRAVGVESTGHIDHCLNMLEKQGYIKRQPGKSRGIALTQPMGIPVIGAIAAGEPLDISPEAPRTFLPIDQRLLPAKVFALSVRGHSMIDDQICDGDYIIVAPQPVCQNGDIVVATHRQSGISGSATVKRFYQEQDQVRLQPANAKVEPLLISKQEWDSEWEVQGKVIAVFRQCHLL